MARIAAQDALKYSDNLVFQSNIRGAQNDGLQTNMIIQSNGFVGIGTTAPGAQLEVDGPTFDPTILAKGAYNDGGAAGGDGGDFYGGSTGSYSCYGCGGVYNDAGEGVQAYGGSSPDGIAGDGIFADAGTASDGIPGDGIDAYGGGTSTYGNGLAGYFSGDVTVTGTLTAPTKDFKIDHPLDPANQYLVHSSVESSEMMNLYTGNVTTDELGLATITLPDWFESLNTDFRYQLTAIGQFAQAIVKDKIANKKFTIMTNAAHVEVSWQITAVRQDAYAQAHPLVVEQAKPTNEKGFYIHPELYGQPEEKQTEWGRRPRVMQQMKAHSEAEKAKLTAKPVSGVTAQNSAPGSTAVAPALQSASQSAAMSMANTNSSR